MSSPEAHQQLQDRIIQNFYQMIDDWYGGNVDYNDIEDELQEMIDDEEVDEYTHRVCREKWDEVLQEEDFWQREDAAMWRQLRTDQSGEIFE